MSDAASIEWFGKLAYMSFLLGPDAPAKAKQWHKLTEQQREWFRASAKAEIDSLQDNTGGSLND